MCRRPIYQEDHDGEETAPPSSFNLQWIISKLPSGVWFGFGSRSREDSTSRPEQSISGTFRNISRFFSTSQLTKYSEKFAWVCTLGKWGRRSNVPLENTPGDTEMVSIEMQQPLQFDSEESVLPFPGTQTDVWLPKRKSSSASREWLLSIVCYKSGLCKLIGHFSHNVVGLRLKRYNSAAYILRLQLVTSIPRLSWWLSV